MLSVHTISAESEKRRKNSRRNRSKGADYCTVVARAATEDVHYFGQPYHFIGYEESSTCETPG